MKPEFQRDLLNQNNRERQKYVLSEVVHNFLRSYRGIVEVMFPGSHLFAFLPAGTRNTWNTSLDMLKILESQVFALLL